MTDSFGARLRRERERQHITLAQVAAATKIKASLFESLERDDVSRWPSGIFRRLFIRAYAEVIGLNPDETCREFTARFPEAGDAVASARVEPTARRVTAAPAPIAAVPAIVSPPLAAIGSRYDDPSDDTMALRLAPAALDEVDDEPGLRLTLADAGAASASAPPPPAPIAQSDTTWAALALDLGVVLLISVLAFVVAGVFWMPLAVTSLAYFFGSTALLGRTAGVAFFATTEPVASAPRPAVRPVVSTDRAVDMRDTLRDPQDSDGDARVARPYAAIRPPVDIESRRARA